MLNEIKKIIGWTLLLWGLIFLVVTIISIFFELDYWEDKSISFYLLRLIYVIVFIMIPMLSGSVLLIFEKTNSNPQ
jgi:hypothetical protein